MIFRDNLLVYDSIMKIKKSIYVYGNRMMSSTCEVRMGRLHMNEKCEYFCYFVEVIRHTVCHLLEEIYFQSAEYALLLYNLS